MAHIHALCLEFDITSAGSQLASRSSCEESRFSRASMRVNPCHIAAVLLVPLQSQRRPTLCVHH